MKAIFYKIDLRLNASDEHAVIVEAMLPYSEENAEHAKAVSHDGTYTIGEYEPSVSEESTTDVVNTLLGVMQ